jgi:hypothetical protein
MDIRKPSGDAKLKSSKLLKSASFIKPTLGALLVSALVQNALAEPITLVSDSVNLFRSTVGANSVGSNTGDRVQFGADIVGGSAGTTIGAVYPATGFTVSQLNCNPLAVNADFCSRTTAYNASRTTQPWTIQFRNGTDSRSVTSPTLVGAETAVPFPTSVTISGSAAAPTISWVIPGGFNPDGLRVNIFDKNIIRADGGRDVVHTAAIASNATSYTLPASFSSGQTLNANGQYAINLQLIETRGHVAFTNNNAEILRRSSSFFDFTPKVASASQAVVLPTVSEGVYNFSVARVGPDSVTFIDPLVAVGYDYATGLGDPNFASVILPGVGDGQFLLAFTQGGVARTANLAAGVQYFFGGVGVNSFRVTDIETSAGLDPNDVAAFVTGLTFASVGAFTGTMTPLTVFVPDPVTGVPVPATLGLVLLGLFGLSRRPNSKSVF